MVDGGWWMENLGVLNKNRIAFQLFPIFVRAYNSNNYP
jgi:hypothetical protein